MTSGEDTDPVTQPMAPDPAASEDGDDPDGGAAGGDGPARAGSKKKGGWRRLLMRVGCGGLILGLIAGTGICGVGGWLLTPGGQSRLAREVESLVGSLMTEGELKIGDLSTNLLNRVRLEDVSLVDGSGRTVVHVRKAVASLQPSALVGLEVHVPTLDVEGVDADLQFDADGNLDVARMFSQPSDPNAPPFQGLPVDLVFDAIAVTDSHIRLSGPDMEPVEIEDVRLSGAFTGRGLRYDVQKLDLSGKMVGPLDGPVSAKGLFTWEGSGVDAVDLDAALRDNRVSVAGFARQLGEAGENVDLDLRVHRLDLPDVDRFVDAGLTGRVGGHLAAQGTLDKLGVSGSLKGQGKTRGSIDVAASIDAYEPSWDGTVDVDGLRVDDLIASLTDPLPVSLKAQIAGSGASWPDEVQIDGTLLEADTQAFGVDIDRAGGSFTLEQGVIRATGLDVAGPAASVTGEATFDTESGALELDLHAEGVDPSKLRAFYVPAELDGSRATTDVKVRVSTYADEVEVEVDGTADISPLRWTESIRARRVRGDFGVRVRGTDVDVTANARGTGIDAYGALVDRAASRDIQVTVRSDHVDVVGGIDASDAIYPILPAELADSLGQGVEVESGTGRYIVHVPLGEVVTEPMTVDVEVDLGAHRLFRYPGVGGTLTVGIVDDHLDLVTHLDATSTRRLADVDMDLDLNTLEFTFPQLQVAPEPRQTWTAIPGGGFVATDTGVEKLDLQLRSGRGEIDVSGTIGAEGPLDLQVEVYDLHLLAVSRLLPMWLDELDGYAGGIISLEGTTTDPKLTADIEVADVAYTIPQEGDVPDYTVVRGLGGRVKIAGEDAVVSLDGRLNVDGTPLTDFDVDLPLEIAFDQAGLRPEEPFEATIELVSGDYVRFGELLGVAVPGDGAVGATLELSGTLLEPVGSLKLDGKLPVQGLDQPLVYDAALDKAEGGALTWEGTAREGATRRAYLNGSGTTEVDRILAFYLEEGAPEPDWARPTLYLDGLSTFLKLYGLPVGSIARVAGVPLDVEGAINGNFAVSGSATRPRLDGDLVLTRGRAATVDISNFRASLRSRDDGYSVSATADLSEDLGGKKEEQVGTIYLEGDVPIVLDFEQPYEQWPRGELDVSMDMDVPFALFAAYDRGVRNAVGFLEVDGSITGPVFDPEPTVLIKSSDEASLVYRPMGVRFRDVNVDVEFDRRAITVREISAQTRASRVRVDTALAGALSDVFRTGGRAVDEFGSLFSSKDKEQDSDKNQRGSIVFSGNAQLNEWAIDSLDLSLTLQRALLLGTSDQSLRMSTGGPLTVKGPLAQPVVRGSVAIDEANVFLDYARALGGASQEIDPRITVHRESGTVQTEVSEASLLDDVDIELGIDVGRATRARLIMPLEAVQFLGATAEKVLQVDVRARLTSADDLRFVQIPCREPNDEGVMKVVASRQGRCGLYHPQVTGIVSILEGTARVLRADFTLSDSFIRFLGDEVYNPNLDIHGEMDVDDQNITMDITGTAYDPKIEFGPSSNDQVFATLALGTSLDGLTAQQVASAVGMAVLNTALGDVNLPSVNIDPRGKVQVGLAVGSSVFVEFTAGGTPRPDENVFEGEVEYTIAKGVLLTAGFGAYAVPFWSDLLLQRKFD